MNILQLVQDGLALIQQVEPGLTATVKAGTALGTLGTATVKVIQGGAQVVTYLITRSKKGAADTPARPTELAPISDQELVVEKDDVAVVVDISRRILRDVARYLDQKGIDADIVVLTNDPQYGDSAKFMDPEQPEEWTKLVQEFNSGMGRVKKAVGAAHVHIFLGVPLPLAFGLGALWGTVDEATVYHWEHNTYHPSMRISRELRGA